MNSLQTRDIFKGAYLLASGCHLIDNHLNPGKQMVFVIEGQEIDRFDLSYRSGHALVNPLQLRASLNLLRDLIFEQTRNGESYGRKTKGMGHRGTSVRDDSSVGKVKQESTENR